MDARRTLQLASAVWLGLFALAVAVYAAVTSAHVLVGIGVVLFSAWLLSLALSPLVERLVCWRIPRGVSVIVMYVVFALLIGALASALVPVVQAEIRAIRSDWPLLLETARKQLAAVPVLHELAGAFDGLHAVTQPINALVSPLFGTARSIGDLLLDLLFIVVLAYFLATSPQLSLQMLNTLMPVSWQAASAGTLACVQERLTRWIIAQAGIALFFGLTYSIGLRLLGVPFALTIGLVGGILEVVPYVGGLTALVIALASALTVNPFTALWVVLMHIVVVFVESHVLAPTFYGRLVGIHPAAVLVALLVGAKLAGVLGVFFAVPLTIVLLTLFGALRKPLQKH